MASVSRVYAARLAGMAVLGPDGESLGRVRDVLISMSIVRQQPRVLGLVVELLTRRRIFVPILRVTAIDIGTGELVVFDSSSGVPLVDAVAASSRLSCGAFPDKFDQAG